jgi:hypothetical protein
MDFNKMPPKKIKVISKDYHLIKEISLKLGGVSLTQISYRFIECGFTALLGDRLGTQTVDGTDAIEAGLKIYAKTIPEDEIIKGITDYLDEYSAVEKSVRTPRKIKMVAEHNYLIKAFSKDMNMLESELTHYIFEIGKLFLNFVKKTSLHGDKHLPEYRESISKTIQEDDTYVRLAQVFEQSWRDGADAK